MLGGVATRRQADAVSVTVGDEPVSAWEILVSPPEPLEGRIEAEDWGETQRKSWERMAGELALRAIYITPDSKEPLGLIAFSAEGGLLTGVDVNESDARPIFSALARLVGALRQLESWNRRL